jgi:hypothetical protein
VDRSRPGGADLRRGRSRGLGRLILSLPQHLDELVGPARSESLLLANPLEDVAARNEDLHSIDLSDRQCAEATCPGVMGNIPMYLDLDHITSTYGDTLVPDVEARMFNALDRAR